MNREMRRILVELDVAAARELVPTMPDGRPMSDIGLLGGIHKARVYSAELPRALRIESLEWCRAHGLKGLRGDELPTICDGEHGGARCADPECWNQ